VFGKHATTGIDVHLHSINRAWIRNETLTYGAVWVHYAPATVEQDDVVLVQVNLAVPKIRRGIRKRRGAAADLIAGVSPL
jgi:hypothetical protein